MSAIADSFNQQLAVYKSQLKELLDEVAKAQADVDASVFQHETALSVLQGKLTLWQGRITSQFPGNYNASTVMSAFVGQIPQYSDSEQRLLDQYLSPSGLKQFMTTVTGWTSDMMPDTDPFWTALIGFPEDIINECHAMSDARIAVDKANNEFSQITQTEQALEATIQGWLDQSQQYAAQIGTIPTLADLINQIKSDQHPITQTQPPSKNNFLLYTLLGLGLLMVMNKKKAATA